jgi:hypothetical protein
MQAAAPDASPADLDRLKLYMARVEPIMASVLTSLMIEQPADPLGYIQVWMARQAGQTTGTTVTTTAPPTPPPSDAAPTPVEEAARGPSAEVTTGSVGAPTMGAGAPASGTNGGGSGEAPAAAASATAASASRPAPPRRGIDDLEADSGESEELTPQRLMQRTWSRDWVDGWWVGGACGG